MTRYIYRCLFLGFSLFFITDTNALSLPVKYLGIEQGLSNNVVTCILQDHYGFMWMGTYNGLNRYDSSNFLVYNNVWGDTNSLVANHVNHLSEDAARRIWVGTQQGLVYFSYDDAKFHPVYYVADNTHRKTKINSNINGLVSGKNGDTYIATDNAGLFVYHPADGLATQIKLNKNNTGYNVQAVMVDDRQQLWLFIKDVGLCVYRSQTRTIAVVNSTLKTAACLKNDHQNIIWIGTELGLYEYNLLSKTLHVMRSPEYPLTSNNIHNVLLSKDNKLWIGTDGGGLNILDLKTRKLSYLLPGESDGLLRSGAVADIYEDKESRKWIATLRGGVHIIDNKLQNFQLIKHDPLNKNSLVNNFVLSFCEDEHNNLWIGTDGGGLSFWNNQKKTYTNFVSRFNDPSSLSSNFVVSIVKDYTNKIWVASFSGGIDLYDQRTGRFRQYRCYNPEKKIEENNLWKLFEDAAHRLWAGTTRDGALYLYNRQLDKFELFDKSLMNIHTLFEDKAGVLWAGDYKRLIKIDTKHKKHEFININNGLRSMLEDKKGNFWIGTEGGGLLLYNRQRKTFKRFTEADGLPGNSVLNILEDEKGRLWMSTYNGISMFDPVSGKFKNYVAADGLQSNQFNYNAALKLRSGEMLFGGIRGFNRFYPSQIISSHQDAVLRVTGLKVNNVPLESRPDYLDEGTLVAIKKITVPYNEATLAFDYVALAYSFPEKIRYAYFLEGWDRTWNDVGTVKTAYYTRLNPGTYTLKIRATNTAGAWLPPVLIHITILSPWYLTWWALSLYVIAGFTALYLIRQNRIRQIKLQYAIEMANANIEKEKELNEKKLSFFTNISHEFRTPLTLIINPIKDLLNIEDQETKSELNTIYRNARRLLGLVDQLLLFRKTESENDSLNIVRNNFYLICNDVFVCFAQQAKTKQISYSFKCENEHIELYADREKIEIALFNLISNAFSFTPDGGKIEVSVEENEHTILFRIADNGYGVAGDMEGKIFDKFYQGKNSSLSKGFGIGMYLVKTFIEQHGGNIHHSKTAGGGMTFSLELLKGNAHFSTAQLTTAGNISAGYISEVLVDEVPETEQKEDGVHLELMISNQQTILVIDGNAEIRAYIRKIFKANYAVIDAADGQEGLLQIRRYMPDIVISDVVMDGLSGIELCSLIKLDTSLSHIPVILLTADYSPELKLKGLEAGAVDFISKPFEKDLLMARVSGMLKIKDELQHYFYSEITLKTDTRTISEIHKDFLYQCIGVIEAALMDTEFDVNRISSAMGMSYSSLLKKIKAITGQSLNAFIRFIRLRKAAELMIHTNCNVNEAAFQVGINDVKYFRAQFHKLFGINPSDFIKKHRKAFQKSYHLNNKKIH